MLVIWNANYLDRLGASGKFVENSKKQTCLYIIGYAIQYSAMLMASRTSNQVWSKSLDAGTCCKCSSQTSSCQCSLFSKESPVVRIFCISGWLAIPFIPDT